MTEQQFTDAVLEQLFLRGFNCQHYPLLLKHGRMESDRLGGWPNPATFAEKCIGLPVVAYQPRILDKLPSRTAGARETWLAIHEAGHAIVGLKAGLFLKGIRFYGDDGFPGEAGLDDPPWQSSTDESLLRMLIRVDMAGNIAQLVYPGCEPPVGGRLSELYQDRISGERPSDFICADARASQLAVALMNWDRKAPTPEKIWDAKRRFLEQGEAEAEEILRTSIGLLDRLVDPLKCGPMTGAAVRAIIEA